MTGGCFCEALVDIIELILLLGNAIVKFQTIGRFPEVTGVFDSLVLIQLSKSRNIVKVRKDVTVRRRKLIGIFVGGVEDNERAVPFRV